MGKVPLHVFPSAKVGGSIDFQGVSVGATSFGPKIRMVIEF
jgi:hypothetical protein